jgi:hypothetical protein
MAKKSAVNKSQLIRDAMAAHPRKTPTEIAAVLKEEHGLKVKPQYISTIKGNMKKKRGRRGRKRAAVSAVSNGFSAVGAALEFIKAAGGLAEAKAALGTLEEIGRVL